MPTNSLEAAPPASSSLGEEGTHPDSRRIGDEQAAGVDRDQARRVIRDNALEVFGFEAALIGQPA